MNTNLVSPNLGQLIIELLDVSEVADADSVKHCFDDLAEANKAKHNQVLSQGPALVHPKLWTDFPGAIFAAKLCGLQQVVPNKRPGEPPKDVYVQMAIIRIKAFTCDVLLSLNTEIDALKPIST